MDDTDQIVLSKLAEVAFAPKRIQMLISSFRRQQLSKQEDVQQKQATINRQLQQLNERQCRLLEAIETGVVELDEITQKRIQQIKISREALEIELSNLRITQNQPEITVRASVVESFSGLLKERLLGADRQVAKAYLHMHR